MLSESIKKALIECLDPILGLSYIDLGWFKEVNGTLKLRLGYPNTQKACDQLAADLQAFLKNAGISMPVEVTWKVARHKPQGDLKPKDGICNVIAVGSGKGGVGKSTVSANIALALSALGARVGILDADIYGPSQPNIFGNHKKPEVEDNRFIPLTSHGISMLSMGSLIDDQSAMIWRGPMVSGALLQLFNETKWPNLDYLILDLPPGTGDIQLTMAQKLPIAGAVVVTTPQDLSLLDAKKAITMFNKVNIEVLGVVENMGTHICSECGHIEPIFGTGGGKKLSETFEVPFLGSIPLDKNIGLHTEAGMPTVVAEPKSVQAEQFRRIAQKVAAQCALRPIDYQLMTQQVLVTAP